MSGFFGSISKQSCVSDVFYGTDYHSHLGTRRAGMAFFSQADGFQRAIHSLEDGYFRNKFEASACLSLPAILELELSAIMKHCPLERRIGNSFTLLIKNGYNIVSSYERNISYGTKL
jgi:hypothetical protein